jgi:hypothetical protein
MQVSQRTARTGVALAALIAIAVLSGCSKKITAVDASRTTIEGQPGTQAQLVVYPNLASFVLVFEDFAPSGPGPEDAFVDLVWGRDGEEGTIRGLIADRSAADAFEIFRSESNGGLRSIKDYPVQPATRYFDTSSSLYTFLDDDPARPSPASYQARGLMPGVAASENSPLTNTATTGDTIVADLPLTVLAPNAFVDSAWTTRWTAVPGAAGYWFQVYQFRSDLRTFEEQFLSTVPAPVYVGKSRDLYLAYLPASVTQYRIGETTGQIFTRKLTHYGQAYFMRVSAVDANGRLIAFSYGDAGLLPVDNGYLIYPLGAAFVVPGSIAGAQRRSIPVPPGLPLRSLEVDPARQIPLASDPSGTLFARRVGIR